MMTQLERVKPLIDQMNSAEREELWNVLGDEIMPTKIVNRMPFHDYPSIVSTPDICGGSARLIRTRIPVWTLERMRQLNVSEIDILRSYPNLKATDLVQAWSYAMNHREEIEKEIRDNEEA